MGRSVSLRTLQGIGIRPQRVNWGGDVGVLSPAGSRHGLAQASADAYVSWRCPREVRVPGGTRSEGSSAAALDQLGGLQPEFVRKNGGHPASNTVCVCMCVCRG